MSSESDLETLVTRTKDAWPKAKQALADNPAILQGHAPSVSLEQLDESLATMLNWAGRTRSPQGFRPVYPIAKVQFATCLNTLASHVENLAGNPSAYLPQFISSLMQAFSPLCAMSLFADQAEGYSNIANCAADLNQHLALTQTAQAELANKRQLLEISTKTADEIERKAGEVTSSAEKVSEALVKIEGLSETAHSRDEEMEAVKDEIDILKESLSKALSECTQLKSTLEKERSDFASFVSSSKDTTQKIHSDSKEQQTLITNLLPGATSAGLAQAFSRGKIRYKWGQWLWGLGFIVAIGVLCWFGVSLQRSIPSDQSASAVWLFLAHRLPLAAPMIWLGWFCAIQYGNVIRLMEDYAFKEATSLAFAGYRDHMEHLAQVSDVDAQNAMEKLALVTITVLGTEPLRLLQKQHQDASPLDKLTAFLRSTKREKKEETSEE